MSATQKRDHCVHCDAEPHHSSSPYCRACGEKVAAARIKCLRAVRKAEKEGLLPRAKTLICVDCQAPAFDYDHRDYSKPLAVDPVCRRCNQLRGPALPPPPFAAGICAAPSLGLLHTTAAARATLHGVGAGFYSI